VAEKVLPYDRNIVSQETGWWCGPASVQILLNSRGIRISESELANEIEALENPGRGDDRDGTDHIGLAARVLNRRLPEAKYAVVEMPNDPPTKAQRDTLRRNIIRSIDTGYGVIVNIVSPPNNRFRPTKGSTRFLYPQWGTIWHYVAVMGYDDDQDAYWVADPGFSPHGGWVTGDSLATLIPPKGYAYSAAKTVAAQPIPATIPPPLTSPATLLSWNRLGFGSDVLVVKELSEIGYAPALELLADFARSGSEQEAALARAILIHIERTNPVVLQDFLKGKQ